MISSSLELHDPEITSRNGFDNGVLIKIFSILFFVLIIIKFSRLLDVQSLTWRTIDLITIFLYPIMLYPFVMGSTTTVHVPSANVDHRLSLMGIPLSRVTESMDRIHRAPGENRTSYHRLFVTTKDGNSYTLYRANRFVIDDYWQKLNTFVPESKLVDQQTTADESTASDTDTSS